MSTLSNNIIYLRKLNEWSQPKVARLLDMPLGRYQHYEAERAEPPINTLVKLSDLYNVDLKDLVSIDISKGKNGSNKPANQFYTKYCQQPVSIKKAIKLLLGL